MSNPIESTACFAGPQKPFRTIRVDVSVQKVKEYLAGEALGAFLDYMMQEHDFYVGCFLDDHLQEFTDWIIYDKAGGAY